jgi:hypothetical protein
VSSLARDLLAEYLRPWKLASLAAGIALLIAGSFYFEAPDWDIPISLIMALLAYLTAPWSLRVLLERRWRWWPSMLFFTWFTVDGCYAIYWHFRNPIVLPLMRDANFVVSLSLYGLCGVIWLYRGSLNQLRSDALARIGTARLRRPSLATISLYVLLDATASVVLLQVGLFGLIVLIGGMFRGESSIEAAARLVLALCTIIPSYFILVADVFLQTSLLRNSLALAAAFGLSITALGVSIGLSRLVDLHLDQTAKIVAILGVVILFQAVVAWRTHALLKRLSQRSGEAGDTSPPWYGSHAFWTLVLVLILGYAAAAFGAAHAFLRMDHLLRIVFAILLAPAAVLWFLNVTLGRWVVLAIPFVVLVGLFGPWSRRRNA